MRLPLHWIKPNVVELVEVPKDLGTKLKVRLWDSNSQLQRHNVKKVGKIWPKLHIFPIGHDTMLQLQT